MVAIVDANFKTQAVTHKDLHDHHFSRLVAEKISDNGDRGYSIDPMVAKKYLNQDQFFQINSYMNDPEKSRRMSSYISERGSMKKKRDLSIESEISSFEDARKCLPCYRSTASDQNGSSKVVRGIRPPMATQKLGELNQALRYNGTCRNKEVASYNAIGPDGGLPSDVKNYFHPPGSITLIVNTRSGVDIGGCDWSVHRDITHARDQTIIPEVGFLDASRRPIYVAHTPRSVPILARDEMPRSANSGGTVVIGQSWDTLPALDLNGP